MVVLPSEEEDPHASGSGENFPAERLLDLRQALAREVDAVLEVGLRFDAKAVEQPFDSGNDVAQGFDAARTVSGRRGRLGRDGRKREAETDAHPVAGLLHRADLADSDVRHPAARRRDADDSLLVELVEPVVAVEQVAERRVVQDRAPEPGGEMVADLRRRGAQ